MPQTFTTHKDADKLRIELSPPVKPVIGLGLFLSGFYFLVAGVYYLSGTMAVSGNPGGIVLMLLFALLYFLVGGSFLRRVIQYEIIEVTHDTISIVNKYLLNRRSQNYSWDKVSDIFFVGREAFTPHPFEGKHFDIGFGAFEKQVNYLISDGNMILVSSGESIRFGRNIPSWDAEDFLSQIEDFTGRNFIRPAEANPIDDSEWMSEEPPRIQ